MHLRSFIAAVFVLISGSLVYAQSERYAIRWVENVNVHVAVPLYAAHRSAPLVYDADTVMAGSREGRVLSFDKARGRLKWSTQLAGSIEANLARDRDHIYAGTITGGVYALDPQSGEIRWNYNAGQEILGQPVSDGKFLYFTTGNNQVFALNVTDGSWAWQYSGGADPELSIRGIAGITMRGSDLYTGFSNGTVVRLDARTGQAVWTQQWKEEGRFQDIDATPVVAGGKLYTVLFGKRLLALDPLSGDTLWTAAAQAHQAPDIHGDRVYLGGLDGKLYVYDSADGVELAAVSVSTDALNQPTIVDDRIYLTDGKGQLTVYDRESLKELWRYSGSVSGYRSPAVVTATHQVFVVTNMGHLYRISPFWRR